MACRCARRAGAARDGEEGVVVEAWARRGSAGGRARARRRSRSATSSAVSALSPLVIVEELARALQAERAAPAPREAPARLAAREVDGDEVALALGQDEEAREAGHVDDGARRRAARARREPGAEGDLAGAEVVDARARRPREGARCRPG